MATLKKYDIEGKELGEETIEDRLLEANAHAQMVKDYIVALLANQRQWSANTKGRKEVKCTSKKPHAQKGTGRARQGTLAAPQYRGGGIVFGPKPKSNSVRIRTNVKEKRAVIQTLLAQKIQNGQVCILANPKMDAPKTKAFAKFLDSACQANGKRVLFLGQMGSAENMLVKSVSNIPRVYYGKASTANGYDIANSHQIVIMESALDDLMNKLGEKRNANA